MCVVHDHPRNLGMGVTCRLHPSIPSALEIETSVVDNAEDCASGSASADDAMRKSRMLHMMNGMINLFIFAMLKG